MAVTNYAGISQRTTAWAATEMLKHAEPILVLQKFGLSKPVPKNKANSVKFRRANTFPVTTTALTEGVAPTAQALTYTDVAVTLSTYGNVVEITDVVADQAEDPVLKDAATLIGEQLSETLELVTWGAIKAGTNVSYSNGALRTAVNTALTLNNIRSAVRTLNGNRARMMTKMLSPSANFGTVPVEGGYVALGHTDLEADIRTMGGVNFTPVAEYGSRQPLCPQEIGSIENVRFVLSPVLAAFADAGGVAGGSVLSTTGANADVYPLIVLGQEAFGCVPLKGSNAIETYVVNPNQASTVNPLGQLGTVGAKSVFTALILNEAWMVRIETAATAI